MNVSLTCINSVCPSVRPSVCLSVTRWNLQLCTDILISTMTFSLHSQDGAFTEVRTISLWFELPEFFV